MTISKEFVPLFYGSGFEKCIILFQILLPSCLFVAFANVVRTQFLIPRKKDKEYIVSLFSGALINLALNAILIPYLGSIGAAIGTLAAQATVCLVQVFLTRHEIDNVHYFVQSIPFVFSGLIMYFIWYGREVSFNSILVSLAIKVGLAGVTYIITLFILITILVDIQRWSRECLRELK